LKYFSLIILTLLLVACNDEKLLIYLESLPVEHVELYKMPLSLKPQVLSKTIEIGAWDMSVDNSIFVLHELDRNKIIPPISVFIIDDIGTTTYDLYYTNTNPRISNAGIAFNTTQIQLLSNSGGFFDNAIFSNILINRGLITIFYLP